MIYIKVDSANRRNLIAICVQYLMDSKFVLRTLAAYDYNASQAAKALKDEILWVKTFEIDPSNNPSPPTMKQTNSKLAEFYMMLNKDLIS